MVDSYKHLNNEKAYNVSFDIEQLANMICDCNYGFNRFISAVINRYKKSDIPNQQKWAEELEKLLDSGLY
ncbi:hypothetical protein OD350_28630 (plasmid) [Clostridium beijerinckii]|uniref:Uncharacterized protein n=1 Tax=Clostridium beijerinckii TaxID=1520 RepID=A0AAX0AYH4_CLOBE|nr:hypothetical protein [Clostridium beijerinckii]NRT34530.1 hypothetical protein [Clostridium beijerinckii]NRT46040.1 hypothetical protein [Clostridium beijerinckii]NRT88125.1 hypothetical protein [Clostridium beijerinckii]NRZ19958.1 hypothetical protein [Clostridium beijerinckii]NYC73553.1 hypothetical protein [Clostridium beijerinckii]